MPQKIDDSELPAVFQTADAASLAGQGTYVTLFRLNLALLVLAAAVSAISVPNSECRRYIAAAGCFLFVFAAGINLLLRSQQYERRWFTGRAIAESAKSMSWKYMMRSLPYDTTASANPDSVFLEDLKNTLEQAKSLGGTRADMLSRPQISDSMRRVRGQDWPERLACYLASRVQDQRAWYSRKSEFNQKRAITLFSFVLVAQLVAVAGLIARIIWPEFPANPASVLASVAAALLAWLQLRRHQELAQSYALAAQDLGIVEARASSVTSDQTLADFVADAENAVSREHAMWLARRETR